MAELELTIMSRGAMDADNLRPLLDQFEAQEHVRVRLRVLQWDTAWAELLKVALYQRGPDVSEIGTTWLGSFVAMDALRPFTEYELTIIGNRNAFIPTVWDSGTLPQPLTDQTAVWAIPWWADTRLLYYRRDILNQVGIAEETAFQSTEQLAHTLQQLQASGVPIPWVVPTHRSRMTIHNLASWVWQAGGRFVSKDGRHTLFSQPQARAGIRAYFDLARYLAPPARDLDDTQSDALFCEGRAAVTLSGPWLLRFASQQVMANTGVTSPPGVPFVGGSHLVSWKHAVYQIAATRLIRFLTSRQVQATLAQHAGLLPTRSEVLSSPPFAHDPFYQVVAHSLQRGRSFGSTPLWGLVEDKLNEVFSELWADLLSRPDLDLDQAIADRLEPLARKLDLTLTGY